MRSLIVLLSVASLASAQGVVTRYLDNTCVDPIAGSVQTLTLGDCYDTGGFDGGVVVSSFPSCASGVPSLAVSDYTECAQPSVTINHFETHVNLCYSLTNTLGIASMRFFCDISGVQGSSTSPAPSPSPTPTPTPTPTPSPTPTPTPSPTDSSTSSKFVTSILSSSSQTSSGISSSTTRPAAETSPSSTAQNSSGGGYSTSDKIALGVGLGLGIPTLIVGIIAAIKACQ